MNTTLFTESSWVIFKHDAELAAWRQHALPSAVESATVAANQQWFRHQGTWFVGVNALPNDSYGKVAGSEALSGAAVNCLQRYVHSAFGTLDTTSYSIAWDRAQVSICYPGYPGKSPEEPDSAHLFRLQRDAAHVDGLLRERKSKARYVREHHAFIFGIPLSEFTADAAPFVVWEGSHKIIQRRLQERLASVPTHSWHGEDISQAYIKAREEVFTHCERKEIYVQVGESFAVHRLAVHGMAPWSEQASSDSYGRVIAYFRPQIINATQWLNAE
ncbi:MAG: hypothetical protein AAF542_02795 [Pseudomonadota bacterium]